MSFSSDDPTEITHPAERPPVASDKQYSLDEGMVERYLLGMLRPDEIEAATQLLSDPAQARMLHKFQAWVERVPAEDPPHESHMLVELWAKIRDQQPTGTPLYAVAAKRAGKLAHEKPERGR